MTIFQEYFPYIFLYTLTIYLLRLLLHGEERKNEGTETKERHSDIRLLAGYQKIMIETELGQVVKLRDVNIMYGDMKAKKNLK